MTPTQQHAMRRVVPAAPARQAESPSPVPAQRGTGSSAAARTSAEEAHERSVMEQAAIDIAAGW